MKINIILVEETGEEVIAEVINEEQVKALGNRLSTFVETVIAEVRSNYPEARGVYSEEVLSWAEENARVGQDLWDYWYNYALENPDELEGEDIEEWVANVVNDELAYNPRYCGW